MKPDRRSFLRSLLALPLAAELDLEKLLWVPKPMIVVPRLPSRGLNYAEITEIAYRQVMPGIIDAYFRSNPLLASLQLKQRYVA